MARVKDTAALEPWHCFPDTNKCSFAAVGPAFHQALACFKGPRVESNGKNQWKQPLFGCMNNTNLTIGVCCVCCFAQAVNANNMAYMTGDTCENECLVSCLLAPCCFYNCYRTNVRAEFRKKYDLEGDYMTDCIMGICFGACMVCQEAVEVHSHEPQLMAAPYCFPESKDGPVHSKDAAVVKGDHDKPADAKGTVTAPTTAPVTATADTVAPAAH